MRTPGPARSPGCSPRSARWSRRSWSAFIARVPWSATKPLVRGRALPLVEDRIRVRLGRAFQPARRRRLASTVRSAPGDLMMVSVLFRLGGLGLCWRNIRTSQPMSPEAKRGGRPTSGAFAAQTGGFHEPATGRLTRFPLHARRRLALDVQPRGRVRGSASAARPHKPSRVPCPKDTPPLGTAPRRPTPLPQAGDHGHPTPMSPGKATAKGIAEAHQDVRPMRTPLGSRRRGAPGLRPAPERSPARLLSGPRAPASSAPARRRTLTGSSPSG